MASSGVSIFSVNEGSIFSLIPTNDIFNFSLTFSITMLMLTQMITSFLCQNKQMATGLAFPSVVLISFSFHHLLFYSLYIPITAPSLLSTKSCPSKFLSHYPFFFSSEKGRERMCLVLLRLDVPGWGPHVS